MGQVWVFLSLRLLTKKKLFRIFFKKMGRSWIILVAAAFRTQNPWFLIWYFFLNSSNQLISKTNKSYSKIKWFLSSKHRISSGHIRARYPVALATLIGILFRMNNKTKSTWTWVDGKALGEFRSNSGRKIGGLHPAAIRVNIPRTRRPVIRHANDWQI